jgi:methylene-fatty-acyl-phospholipid synthase
LNVAVYRRLGDNGVYYGTKLGKKVAWKTGFPFSVIRHPQYVGAVLTIGGFVALVWGQAPNGVITLGAYWALLYCITALQEQFL